MGRRKRDAPLPPRAPPSPYGGGTECLSVSDLPFLTKHPHSLRYSSLGLDRIGSFHCTAPQHNAPQSNAAGGDDGDDWAFTPTSKLPDAERFRGVEPLKMTCRACHQQADFQGVFAWDRKKPVNSPADLKVG